MLYRNPETAVRRSFVARTLRALSEIGAARRRRLAEIDLLTMNGYLKRDLGLEGVDRLSRW
jgi:hypothetical protein